MLSHTDLKKGVMIIINNQPYEVLEATPQRYAQRKLMIQTKLKSLITGNVIQKTIHQGEAFEKAVISKIRTKFLYTHPDRKSSISNGASKDRFFFCEESNSANRFDLTKEQIGETFKYLKPNTILDALVFQGKVINILLPIKIQLKVTEAPPGVKGERAQAGTKTVTLETGVQINVPLFVKQDDIVELNTETSEYVRRVE